MQQLHLLGLTDVHPCHDGLPEKNKGQIKTCNMSLQIMCAINVM